MKKPKKPKELFKLVVTETKQGFVYVNGEQVDSVDRIFVYGEPFHYTIVYRNHEKSEDGRIKFDKNGIVKTTKVIEIEGCNDEEPEGTVE